MERVYIDEIEKELSKSAIGGWMKFGGLAAALKAMDGEDDSKSKLPYGGFDPKNCEECRRGTPVSHNGSARCRSGSIASGGTRAHCTCDTCY